MKRSGARAAAVVVCAVLAGAGGSSDPPSPADRAGPGAPNVLVVITDDQRVGTFEVMPHTRRHFLRGGRVFDPAFATTPLCCPSRASIFTGRFAHNHGVLTNADAPEMDPDTTVQRYLHDAGYTTAIVGKYLSKIPIETNPEYFDRWATFGSSWHTYKNGRWNFDGRVRRTLGYYRGPTMRSATGILRAMEGADDIPWFLVVSLPAPHSPFRVEDRHRGERVPRWRPGPAVRETDLSDKPAHVQVEAASSNPARTELTRRRQLRTLMTVDDMVGELFRELKVLQEDRGTLAIYLSDNGYMWGEHGLIRKGHPYTDSVRIPLLMRWPGHIEPGSESRRLATNLDVAPTVLDAAGLDVPSTMDGISMLSNEPRETLLLEFTRDVGVPTWASLRTEGYQYTEYYDDQGAVAFREYYSMAADLHQLHNLFVEGGVPDEAALHEALEELRMCAGEDCRR